MMNDQMWWHDGSVGWGGWVAMLLAMAGIWALVVFGVGAYFRGLRGDRSRSSTHLDAMQILDGRFARGEIDADEYRARRKALSGASESVH
jgi:putative membrane protein